MKVLTAPGQKLGHVIDPVDDGLSNVVVGRAQGDSGSGEPMPDIAKGLQKIWTLDLSEEINRQFL
ncbi:MAG TPA: hypothetical protein VEZ24_09150 [Microvirga sp.]|nr:hypothetical protein [Microvirga sp.]